MNDTGRDNRIEAYFLGVLALIVFGVVIFAAVTTKFGAGAAGASGTRTVTTSTSSGGYVQTLAEKGEKDIVCQCYDAGFELAGKTSNVQGTAYRTGFSQCRARGSVEGGEAWTAGWNARRSGRTYEATCKAYKRRNR